MAKKISLREFQETLVKRLTTAQQGQTTHAALGVQAGREYWLLDLTESGEIIPTPPLSHVPLTQPWFRGLANIRGSLYSVVDFAAFQGGEPTPASAESRLLLVGARLGLNSAILVTRALGLRNMDEFEPADRKDESRPWVGDAFVDLQGRPWNKLLVRNLVMQPRFLDVGI
ncbi:MAG TPA: chemotaxis protein CheW [Rhodocyclaceae bacterium]|nr:chemotaxis protein CheW [Rhodocyclaceae bacterium]HMV53407.1 chemotaxis protein CheW [Rhodocyclaceae bacterium]HMZ83102.1 chemotaxis protein CheW [Rhodocyclaceae bacterium]HNA02665.1 chemotaxis protein CheW [Rhodocyclaceae bacterium]HNB77750.1 chemotaxis protein CheW [Rhodocyclaceae bacterium]